MMPHVEPSYRLWLPCAGRKWINANHRVFWMERNRRTHDWRLYAKVRALAEHMPYFARAHVVCELRFSDARRRDPANWAPTAKACIDGLVDAGVFDDDDASRILGPDMRIGLPTIGANIGMLIKVFALEDGGEGGN